MAHFLRRAAATTRIHASGPFAASSRYPSPATVRRLAHTQDSPVPPAVPPEVSRELSRIKDDFNGRHGKLADDLAKLHGEVMEGYSAARIQQGDSYPRIKTVAWRVCASVVFFFLGSGCVVNAFKMISALVKETRMDVEADLESRIAEKVRAARAEAFEAGRRSALLELESRPSWRRG